MGDVRGGIEFPVSSIEYRVAGLKAAEVVTESVRWVAEAQAGERSNRVSIVVRSVAEVNAGALVEMLVALARQFPEIAGVVAAEAVTVRPEQAAVLAAAGVGAVPMQAGRIVAEMCRRQPRRFAEITIAAGRAGPDKAHSILFELSEALPELRPYLERAKTLVSAGRAHRPGLNLIVQQAVEILENEGTDQAKQWLPLTEAGKGVSEQGGVSGGQHTTNEVRRP